MTKMAADKVPDKLPAIHEERSFSLNKGTAPILPNTRGKSQHFKDDTLRNNVTFDRTEKNNFTFDLSGEMYLDERRLLKSR